jgi:hypothetical protein
MLLSSKGIRVAQVLPGVSLSGVDMFMLCQDCQETRWGRRWMRKYVPLSNIQSLYDCRAEAITVYAPSTLNARETHARPVRSLLLSLALRLC